ncbi:gastrula zinc finger protein XlCGF57.1-like isoform X2 [Syngnathus acus]|uniref:gastrula zinc finger protein XlCGF57.1-like isoform X2 n=1 Tax=Syngnathus acus TaxID=161584 RepID=UPI001885B68C|nr:gastrula zinc finger protein XlCGF57.1-like isoform X2 [Syngnathus acus]
MCKIQMLRTLVKHRLDHAVEEIVELFEKTIVEYEEELSRTKKEIERQRDLLDAILNPQVRLDRAEAQVQQALVTTQDVHVKEEEEEEEDIQSRQDAEADVTTGTMTLVFVKSEEDNKAVLAQLHHSEESRDSTSSQHRGYNSAETPSESHNLLEVQVQQALVTSQDVQVKEEEEDMRSRQDVEADVFVKREDNEAQFSQLHHSDENRDSSSSQHSGALQPDNSAPPSDLDDRMSPHSDADSNITNVSSNGDISPTISSERGETLVQKSEMTTGVLSHADKKPFKCPLCDKGFSRKMYMMAHQKAHSKGFPFTCSICAKGFLLKSQLRAHTRSHTGERPFTCSVCAKSFFSNGQLRIHSRIHTGERPFTCSVCSKCFITRGHLQRHSKIHSGERPFSCNVCNKSYVRKSHMESHMLTHTQTGEKPFDCSVCGKRFSTRQYLRCHMKRHSEGKRFTCPVCFKDFANKAYIGIHMATHTGEKLFSCDTCNEKFTFGSQVKSHVCTGNK